MQLRENAGKEAPELWIVLYWISVNGEGSQVFADLQLLEFFELTDKIYMEVQIFKLRKRAELLADRCQSIVAQINPYQLLPFFVGKQLLNDLRKAC